jgi:hypothetical protein
MIDTVVLALDMSKFSIPKSMYDAFTPSARGLLEPPYYSFGKQKVLKCVLNPSASDKKKGLYLPRITLFKAVRAGGYSLFAHIEFSVPKILYNNNFDELADDDFQLLCQELAKRLRYMGFFIFSALIETAEVKTIHYGKNIVKTDYTTASSVINDIAKSNITTRKDIDIRAYKNSGEAVHFFNTKQGFAVYDKVKELNKAKKTEKGLLEKDAYCQLSLFDDYQPRKPFEVVRIEARYNDRRVIKSVLTKTNTTINGLTFRDLFSSDIAKKVLQYEFEQIKAGNLAFDKSKAKSIEDFATEIVATNPDATPSKILKAIAIKSLFNETGSRDIRKLIGANSSQWSRLVKDMSNIRFRHRQEDGFDIIDKELKRFTPVKVKDYVDNMKGIDV